MILQTSELEAWIEVRYSVKCGISMEMYYWICTLFFSCRMLNKNMVIARPPVTLCLTTATLKTCCRLWLFICLGLLLFFLGRLAVQFLGRLAVQFSCPQNVANCTCCYRPTPVKPNLELTIVCWICSTPTHYH